MCYTPLMEPTIKYVKLKTNESGGSEIIGAEKIDNDTFQLLETSTSNCTLTYGTIIKVKEDEKGELFMLSVFKKSDYVTRKFMLDNPLKSSEIANKLLKPIIDIDGYWEIAFGGVVFIHLLKDSNFNILRLFDENNYTAREII